MKFDKLIFTTSDNKLFIFSYRLEDFKGEVYKAKLLQGYDNKEKYAPIHQQPRNDSLVIGNLAADEEFYIVNNTPQKDWY